MYCFIHSRIRMNRCVHSSISLCCFIHSRIRMNLFIHNSICFPEKAAVGSIRTC